MNQTNNQTYFARGLVGYQEGDIGITQPDRRYMFYTIGRTGVGKSTMLHNMLAQDLLAGRGVGLVDPHGDLAEAVLGFVPKQRKNDVIYLNPADQDFPVGLNVLETTQQDERYLLAANLMSIFHKSWAEFWGPRMSYLLHNALLALLENPGSTLLSMVRLLTDQKYRDKIVKNVDDPVVRHYWEKEFARLPDKLLAEVVSPVQNKIGAYLTNRPLRNMLGQSKGRLSFDDIINHRKILIANLAKGKIGEEAANLLGSLLVTKLQLAAMGRAHLPEAEREDFYLYVDEFHNFTTESFADILAEARKYRLNLILANQYLGQLDRKTRDAVLANVGTMVVFRVGPDDAKILEQEFEPHYSWGDLINLSPYEVRYKLMRNGEVERPYTATTWAPLRPPGRDPETLKQGIVGQSRQRYSQPRETIEQRINTFLAGQRVSVR